MHVHNDKVDFDITVMLPQTTRGPFMTGARRALFLLAGWDFEVHGKTHARH